MGAPGSGPVIPGWWFWLSVVVMATPILGVVMVLLVVLG